MGIHDQAADDYRGLIKDFVNAANKDPAASHETISRLSDMFQSAVAKKAALLKAQNVETTTETTARAVANDISRASPNTKISNQSYGRPTWQMDDMHELFNWLTQNQETSTLAKGIVAGLHALGIKNPPVEAQILKIA